MLDSPSGFFPKWMILAKLFPLLPFISLILILGSLMNLYYYLMIIINMMISSLNPHTSKKFYSTPTLLFSIISGPIILSIYAMTMLY